MKNFCLKVLLLVFLTSIANAQSAQPLSNSSFEEELQGWGTRTTTPGVYTFLSPGNYGDKNAELKVTQE
jgi:hypothetical protein